MPRPFIPKSLDDVTPAWLTHTLRESGALGGASVVAREVDLLGEGEGFMGTTARLRLTLDRDEPGAPASLIAKLPTTDRRVRAQGELLGIYEREIFFYREFASRLPDATPRCHYCAMDPNPSTPESQRKTLDFLDRAPTWLIRALIPVGGLLARMSRRRYAMLLEDMAPARVGDQVGGGHAGDLEAMLRHLGRMHAFFWNSPDVDSRHWIPKLDASPRPIMLMYVRALPGFEKQYGARTSREFREQQRWIVDHGVELVRAYQRRPFTLNHGDYRLDNVFFTGAAGADTNGADGAARSAVVLFDWQIPCQGPGAYDLAYFLSSTLEPDVPRERERALMRIYHDELVAGGIGRYDFDALQADYERALLLLVQRLSSSLPGIDAPNDRGRELFERWVDRLDARIVGLDPDRLLEDAYVSAATLD